MNIPQPEIIDTKERAYELLKELHQETGPFGIDCETVGIDPRRTAAGGARDARIVAWSLAAHDSWGRYRRWFIWGDLLDCFAAWLEHAPLVGHNVFGFDWHMFRNHSIYLRNIVADTLALHRLLTNGRSKQHGLKHLMKSILGLEQPGYAELFSRRRNLGVKTYKRISTSVRDGVSCSTGGAYSVVGADELIPLDELARDYPQRLPVLYNYASLDALGTLMLYERFVH